ncbi:hypothetical protein AB4455_23325 [Vibrio sp. 10N.261.46.E12]|uniref:hypothetical protein n=1 Tax=unclassified Vibrio TaxID=2614977 RepID=UPI000975B3CD|nr:MULTISPECIES: hypothetical protein [unclassified Vibrio]OMO34817.1 hypothetical protein BH584_11975 [Vibrio sp. 10N.261.45.E1]PMJ33800.1 hypothetical protein BCU27_03855 [Vibrio sp. 10N.286.45.B6]PML86410.1 hypothetical protein BCT66_13970 [Vibrio sp. 10N.261.49.E11]PMM68080.1 hypothetical protein BCT48_12900 [Vibrio sp. 10N.261.46.F12]PMM90491.1 hypothetical protein BCT46_22890 [Vibrio sp. 10N.261.46.E8]
MKFNTIYLNDRRYKIYDIGEGQSVMFIFHRENSVTDIEEIVRLKLKEHQRVIIVDLSDDFPSNISEVNDESCQNLIEDLHLLADVYWLDNVAVESNYINKPVHATLSSLLGNRCFALTTL